MAERRTVEAIGAPAAVGPYSHAVAHGNVLYCSGQVPIDPDTGKLVEAGPGEQAAQCLENLEVVCAAAGSSLAHALSVSVFVTDLAAGARRSRRNQGAASSCVTLTSLTTPDSERTTSTSPPAIR